VLGVTYHLGAADLWRWVDAPQDDVVGEFVARFAGLDPRGREQSRARLGQPDMATLVTYGQRCTLAGLRHRDLAKVVRAFDALSAIALDRLPDDRDVYTVAALAIHVGQGLDESLATTVGPAVERADRELTELLIDLLGEHLELVDYGYREIDGPAGPAFLEDEGETFRPRADLVAAAYGTAAILEADRHHVGTISVGNALDPVWVGEGRNPAAVAAAERLSGCLVVDSDRLDTDEWHSVLVFLAEAEDETAAATIATAADGLTGQRCPQFGVAAGRLCAIVAASSPNLGTQPVENATSLARFRPAVTGILSQANS